MIARQESKKSRGRAGAHSRSQWPADLGDS